jgi:transcriptional regulator GlxA family with amidase domain
MEQHLDDSLTIENIAAAVGLCRRQLERLFENKAGMSPATAYTMVRMKKARHLLTQSNAQMIEIALDVGYNNASHFSRTFKRVYGITPTELRSSAKQELACM